MKLEIKIEKEIKKQISKYPFKKGTIVYVAGNTFNFGMGTVEIKKFCKYFLNYLKKITGPNGGVIVPTATLNLIKNKRVYDKKNTKSYTMGIFSEYVRNQKKSHRSDHPLWSFSGLGTKIKKILKNVSYSAYGEGSVFDKLMNYKTTEKNNEIYFRYFPKKLLNRNKDKAEKDNAFSVLSQLIIK